jgi:hypothetical protein
MTYSFFRFCKYYKYRRIHIINICGGEATGGVILDKDKNREVTREKKKGRKGTYISEVQKFHKPEDYEDAFKKYYPKEK